MPVGHSNKIITFPNNLVDNNLKAICYTLSSHAKKKVMQFQKKLHFDRFNNTRMTCYRKSLPNRSSPNQSLICHFNFNQTKTKTKPETHQESR